jgi:hypothetical protein
MSGCEKSDVCPAFVTRAKSPLTLAIYICFAIALGAVGSTLDASIFDNIISGKWLTASLDEAQQRNTAAVAALETKVEAIVKDVDFVAARVNASVRRNEDQAFDRFVALDAEIAALKEKIASVQTARLTPPARVADALLGAVEKSPADANDMIGLRSSLHDLAASQHGAVAAITKRLDRIEIMVGLSTDVTSSVANPLERRHERRRMLAEKPVRKQKIVPPAPQMESTAERGFGQPERGHMFNVKPISQQGAPLRMSRLPG